MTNKYNTVNQEDYEIGFKSGEKATKTEMIKEFEKMIDEIEWGFTEMQEGCSKCKKETKFWDYNTNPSICPRCSIKQKLGELKT